MKLVSDDGTQVAELSQAFWLELMGLITNDLRSWKNYARCYEAARVDGGRQYVQQIISDAETVQDMIEYEYGP